MFYPKIGDYVLLRDDRVARIAQGHANFVFSIEILPDLRPATCSKEFIVKILPPVDLDSLRLGDKVRLASGKICEVNGIDRPTDRSWFLLRFPPQDAGVNYCRYNRVGRNLTISTSDQSLNIVEIIPQVDLHTLEAGDTVELASGKTKKVTSAEYSPSEAWRGVKVVFNADKAYFVTDFLYNRNGTLPGFPVDSIVKIIPKPKLDFSINTVDLTTLKEGDTVHLSDRSTAEVVSVASKMLGTVYVIRLRRFGFSHYCVDGCSLDKDKPSIVRIVDTSTAKERVVRVAISNVEISFNIDPAALPNVFDEAEVNLQTLQPGDTVELANGKTEKVERITYGFPENPFHVYFANNSVGLNFGWSYSASGNCAGVEGRRITRIIPQPKPSPTLALEMSPDGRFITPRITVRGTGATAATVRSKPKLNLYTLQPGAVVTLANGNTKEVLKVDLQSRAHTNHVCITLADGVWIYNPDGTRPPGRDSAYNIVSVTTAAILADIKAHKEFAESVDVTTIKRGDKLTLANGKEVIAGKVTARPVAGEIYTVWRENGCPIVDVHVNGTALRAESHAWSIVKITPKPKPTPLTIGGHIVEPGDVLTRANGDRIVVNKITPEPCGNWKVWHGAHGNWFFTVDSSGHCSALPSLSITAVVPNQTAALHPWPKPITTPPTKKDADPIRQVAVLDKEGDWMQEEWWTASDMLAAGEITGWAHTQAWHDASDPWN